MKDNQNKCKKCGSEMKKSGSYLHTKEEGQPVYRGPSLAYYCCMNEDCEDYGKVIEVQE